MGFLSNLFGKSGADKTFSFDDLEERVEVDINEHIENIMQQAGEYSFPDDEGVTYRAEQVWKSGDMLYAEVVPSRSTGYSKYVFVIKPNNDVDKCYCYENGGYTLLFS